MSWWELNPMYPMKGTPMTDVNVPDFQPPAQPTVEDEQVPVVNAEPGGADQMEAAPDADDDVRPDSQFATIDATGKVQAPLESGDDESMF